MPKKGRHCIECGKPCCFGCLRCGSCARKKHNLSPENLAKRRAALYKGGRTKSSCIECGASITKGYTRCSSCAQKINSHLKKLWEDPKFRETMTTGREREKNPNWKGGKWKVENSFLRKIRNCGKYIEWKNKILERDVNTYPVIPKNIQVHHRKSLTRIIREHNIKTMEEALSCDELWDINNGLSLTSAEHLIVTWMSRMKKPSLGFVAYIQYFVSQHHEIFDWCK
jgi:hypothetical protein